MSLSKLLRAGLRVTTSFKEHETVNVNGNTVRIFRSIHGEARYKKISALIMNCNSNPDLLENAGYMIEERIRTKAEKCAALVGRYPLWLVLRNDYFLLACTSTITHCLILPLPTPSKRFC